MIRAELVQRYAQLAAAPQAAVLIGEAPETVEAQRAAELAALHEALVAGAPRRLGTLLATLASARVCLARREGALAARVGADQAHAGLEALTDVVASLYGAMLQAVDDADAKHRVALTLEAAAPRLAPLRGPLADLGIAWPIEQA